MERLQPITVLPSQMLTTLQQMQLQLVVLRKQSERNMPLIWHTLLVNSMTYRWPGPKSRQKAMRPGVAARTFLYIQVMAFGPCAKRTTLTKKARSMTGLSC